MKQKFYKVGALLLALVLCRGILPVNTSAYTGGSQNPSVGRISNKPSVGTEHPANQVATGIFVSLQVAKEPLHTMVTSDNRLVYANSGLNSLTEELYSFPAGCRDGDYGIFIFPNKYYSTTELVLDGYTDERYKTTGIRTVAAGTGDLWGVNNIIRGQALMRYVSFKNAGADPSMLTTDFLLGGWANSLSRDYSLGCAARLFPFDDTNWGPKGNMATQVQNWNKYFKDILTGDLLRTDGFGEPGAGVPEDSITSADADGIRAFRYFYIMAFAADKFCYGSQRSTLLEQVNNSMQAYFSGQDWKPLFLRIEPLLYCQKQNAYEFPLERIGQKRGQPVSGYIPKTGTSVTSEFWKVHPVDGMMHAAFGQKVFGSTSNDYGINLGYGPICYQMLSIDDKSLKTDIENVSEDYAAYTSKWSGFKAAEGFAYYGATPLKPYLDPPPPPPQPGQQTLDFALRMGAGASITPTLVPTTEGSVAYTLEYSVKLDLNTQGYIAESGQPYRDHDTLEGKHWNFYKAVRCLTGYANELAVDGQRLGYQPNSIKFGVNVGTWDNAEVNAEEAEELVKISCGYYGSGNEGSSTLTFEHGIFTPHTGIDEKVRGASMRGTIPWGTETYNGMSAADFYEKYGIQFTNKSTYLVEGCIPTEEDAVKCFNAMSEGLQYVTIKFTRDRTASIDVEAEEEKTDWLAVNVYAWADNVPYLKREVVPESGEYFWERVFYNVPDGSSPIDQTSYGGINDPKYAYCVISGSNPEHPTYYTEDQPAYSEFKQGTVTTSGSTSEKFNALTGTVTFTETEVDALKSSDYYYGKDGHYYHFFASGGQEFVVEFDGKFYKNQSVTRNFTFAPSSSGSCSESTLPCDNDQHACQYDPETGAHIGACCSVSVHMSAHPHTQGASHSFSYTYTGLSYVAIENCRVWQLYQSNLKGTGTLLNQSEVTADIKSTAPGASWNIADMSRPGMTGRMVYDYATDGYVGGDGGGDIDNLRFTNHTITSTCGEDGTDFEQWVSSVLSGGMDGAWCVSDFLVLHTTMGDQSICYHEYRSIDSQPIANSVTGSAGGTAVGETKASVSIDHPRTTVEFEVKEYEEVWKSNGQTSEGFSLEPSGVTYGGYSGNWSNSTRYKSTGQGSNMSDWSSKQAYQNKSKRYGAHSNSNLYIGQNGATIGTGKVSPVLRLMDDTLVIPDNRVNGRYDFGPSTVFYKNLVDFNCNPVYARGHIIESCPIYNNQRGFTLDTPYSQPSLSAESMFYKQCNSVVIYNPVSNSKAIIISLPKDRDQRTVDHTTADVTLNNSCPGDDSCPYMHVECNITEHLHNENCYTATAYEVHTGYNAHQHTSSCAYHMGIDPNQPPRYEVHHGPSCTYSGETHYSTDPVTCSQCGHSTTCGGSTFSPQLVQVKVYDCNDKPKNVHVCVTAGQMVHSGGNNAHVHTTSCGGDVNLGTFNYNATGTTAYSFTATSSGSIRFYSTSYNKDPRGRIYINGVCVVDNDDGGGNLNFDTGTIYYSAGDRVVCDVYQYGSTGAGWAVCYIQMNGGHRNCGNQPLNTHICTSECKVSTIGCYTAYKGEFTCNDPHHTWDYNWKLYTYGMQHRSGKICTGRDCTDTSDVKGLGGVWIPLSDFANGALVRHGSGSIHVTATRNGTCSFCKHAYNEVIFDKLYDTSRANVSETEWTHYPYGDARCWMACNDPKNHNVYPTEINYKGKNYDNAGFINLDWPFTVLFPNEGNFYGTGRKNSGFATAERGYGYTNNMDTTEWTHAKWVIFPFDVVYNGQTFLENERIYLDVPTTEFVFYCPLENYEAANAEVIYGTVAINDPTPFTVDCGRANHTNINQTTCHGKTLAHAEDADKRFYIDVVGRIGALTMEDVGDFRWSNFFKMPVDGWLVPNVVRKVDVTKQNNLLMDTVDVRGVPLTDTKVRIYPDGDPDTSYLKNIAGDTYGNRPERRNLLKIHEFPLTPDLNEQTALKRQPVRIGYDAYLDLETLGNYYGESTLNEDGTYDQTLVWIKPHYYRLSLKDGSYVEADVYVDLNGDKKLINDCLNNSPPNLYYGTETQVNLNWVEELARRNYTGPEVSMTNAVHTKFGLNLPFGSSWVYGNYNVLNLWSRNRTSVGTNMTYEQSTDPSDRIDPIRYGLQGARWHLNLGLPSSSVFVKHGDEPTKKNIDEFKGGDGKDYVIFVALEIYAQGNVWTLAYDGNTINVPFTIIPDPSDPTGNTPGRTYDPVVPYPSGKLEDPTIEMPIVEIISITHSSSEDLDVVGVA